MSLQNTLKMCTPARQTFSLWHCFGLSQNNLSNIFIRVGWKVTFWCVNIFLVGFDLVFSHHSSTFSNKYFGIWNREISIFKGVFASCFHKSLALRRERSPECCTDNALGLEPLKPPPLHLTVFYSNGELRKELQI